MSETLRFLFGLLLSLAVPIGLMLWLFFKWRETNRLSEMHKHKHAMEAHDRLIRRLLHDAYASEIPGKQKAPPVDRPN